MKWKKKPKQNIEHWHRRFVVHAYDPDSQMHYALQRVWMRNVKKQYADKSDRYYYEWEYRDGNTAPDVKQSPVRVGTRTEPASYPY